MARADEIPPPKIIVTDANGVDLLSGKVSITELANSIGPKGPGSIQASNVLRADASNLISSILSYVRITDDGITQRSTLVLDGASQEFTGTAGLGDTIPVGDSVGNFAGGANSTTGIIYTAPDGTKAVFNYVTYNPNHPIPAIGYLKSITYPSGEVLTYTRTSLGSDTVFKIESSLGYALISTTDFRTPIVANLTQGDCSDTACGGPTFDSQFSLGRSAQRSATGAPPDSGPLVVTFTNATGDNPRVYTYGSGGGLPGDSEGRVVSVSRGGATWTYAWSVTVDSQPGDPFDGIRTVTVTGPDGYQRIVTSRISTGHILSDRQGALNGAGGRITYYSYGPSSASGPTGSTGPDAGFGRLHLVTMPEGDIFEYVYDGYANITSRKHYPKSGSSLAATEMTASYSCRTTTAAPVTTICNQPDWIRDENGAQTDFTYDLAHGGGVATVTRPAGANGVRPQTRYTYQQVSATYIKSGAVVSGAPAWRLASTSACRTQTNCSGTADELVTEYGYESGTGAYHNARLISVTMRSGNTVGAGAVSSTTTYAYDARGDVIQTDGPLSGAVDLVQTRYDASRWVVGTVGADPDGAGPLQYRATKTIYRADGQVQTAYTGVVADRSDATFANSFQVKSSVSTEYDGYARVSAQASKNAAGATYALTETSYDALGRVDCVAQRMDVSQFASQPGACNGGSNGVGKDPDRIIKTTYDRYGQVETVRSGLNVDEIYDRRTAYTANGKVQSETDGENNTTLYAYDGLDRLVKVTYPSTSKGSQTQNSADYEQYDYDAVGNRTYWRRRDPSTARAINTQYDGLNRPVWKEVQASAQIAGTATYTYSYDNFGNMLTASEGGRTITSDYDALGRLKSETGPVGTVAYDYDAASHRTQITWPDSFFVTYGYDDAGALKTLKRAGSDTLVTYGYDDLGRRASLSRGNGATTSYAYDPSNLLLSSIGQTVGSGGNTADNVSYGFLYNPAGQMTRRTISNSAYVWNGAYAVDRTYVANGLNQYTAVGSASPTYDERGNLKFDGTTTWKYDLENRLRGTTAGAALIYDPLGRLFQTTTVGGTVTRYLYDGPNLIGEYTSTNGLQRRYVHGVGTDEPLVRYNDGGTTAEYLLADHQGSIVAVTNSAGAVTTKNTYDEYGLPGASNVGLFQYTGQVYLADLAIYHYKARAYSPTLGRFLQTDPTGYDDGLNWYAYVGNDPLNGTDPTGMWLMDDGSQGGWTEFSDNVNKGSKWFASAVTKVASLPGKIMAAEANRVGKAMTNLATGQGTKADVSTLIEVGVNVGLAVATDGATEVEAITVTAAKTEARSAGSLIDRAAFGTERRAFWRAEAAANGGAYGADDLARMKRGLAPTGPDGFPMELHHIDGTPNGGLSPMSRTDHRLGDNMKKNHPWLYGN